MLDFLVYSCFQIDAQLYSYFETHLHFQQLSKILLTFGPYKKVFQLINISWKTFFDFYFK